jgi:hypothetical protein
MATKTMGTAATTTLTAVQWLGGGGNLLPADIATIQQSILDDQTNTNPIWPGAWDTTGMLFVPNRGVLRMLPGDWIAVDSTGFPILLSSLAAGSGGSGNWRHS